MKQKYKITRRGKIVFVILIMLIFLIIIVGIKMFKDYDDNEIINIPEVIDNEKEIEEVVVEVPVIEDVVEDIDYSIYDVSIYFQPDKLEMLGDGFEKLKEILKILFEDETIDVVVEGNINGYPYFNDTEFGLWLSLNRALIVKEYLIEMGIEEDRIIVISNGSSTQNRENSSEENQRENRCADICIKPVQSN